MTQPALKKKSICFLSDYMIVGGMERVVCDAITLLSDEYDITVFLWEGYASSEIRSMLSGHARIICGHTNRLSYLISQFPFIGGFPLKSQLKEHYDFVVSLRGMFIQCAYSGIADKYIYWNHSDKDVLYTSPHLSLFRKLNKVRLKAGYRKFDAVWTPNDLIKTKLEQAFGCSKIAVLPNQIDMASIEKQSLAPVCDKAFHPEAPNIIAVGRLSVEKGQQRLIHAVEALIPRYPGLRLVLVGDGAERANLERYTAEHDLGQHVYFAGTQSNPYCYIRQADVLVLPSYQESFGLVLLEAMALRTPVITTATTGGLHVTDNGTYGMVAENTNSGILDALRSFLDNDVIQAHTLDAAFERAAQFDRPVFTAMLKRFLKQLSE